MPEPISSVAGDGTKGEATPQVIKVRGLEGVVALDSTLSFIDGGAGTLIYNGYSIEDLGANATFEEVAYLLWKGRLPNRQELDDLHAQLQAARPLPAPVLELLERTPRDANPTAVLRTAVSALALSDPEAEDSSAEANYRKAVRVTAQLPTIVAAFDRLRKGEAAIAPKQAGSLASDFLYMLNGEAPGEAAERTFDTCLVLHAEHGLNASTFAGRVIASTLSDLYSAVTGAIGALKGPLHGGANIAVMQMLLDLDQSGQDPAAYVRRKLAEKERIMGFGHRVYKVIDPRAVILREMVEDLSEERDARKWYDYSVRIMETMEQEKGLYPNVDFFSASVYYMLGIETDLYTPIFAMSRATGWTAHLLEQWKENRLIRPRAEYVGPRGLSVTPIEDR